MKAQLDRLRIERGIREYKISEEAHAELENAYWRSLKRMNSGTVSGAPLKKVARALQVLDERTISNGYPILAFAIESCVVHYKKTDEAFRTLKRTYGITINATKLVLEYLEKVKLDTFVDLEAEANAEDRMSVFHANERDKAIEVLAQWAREQDSRVYYVDGTFDVPDLEAIAIIRNYVPVAPIVIVSRKYADERYPDVGITREMRARWGDIRPAGSSQVQVIVVGAGASGDIPVQFRGFIGSKSHLRFSASWRTLGSGEIEITRESAEPVPAEVETILALVKDMPEVLDGVAIEYLRFSL